jgi:hypothetical protein
MALKSRTSFYLHPSFALENKASRATTVSFGDGESSAVDPKTGRVELPTEVGDSTGWQKVQAEKPAGKLEPTDDEKFHNGRVVDLIASIGANEDVEKLKALAELEGKNPKGARPSIVKAIEARLATLTPAT